MANLSCQTQTSKYTFSPGVKTKFRVLHLFAFVMLATNVSVFAENKIYTKALKAYPVNMNPKFLDEVTAAHLMTQVGEGLVKYDGDILSPGIAQSWVISKDQTEYTFHIRKAQFSNGEAITVEDIIYNFKNVLSPGSTVARDLLLIQGSEQYHRRKTTEVTGIRKVGENKLTIKISNPFPPFLDILTSPNYVILPKETIEKLKKKTMNAMVSSGPYFIASTIHDKQIELNRNPFYYDNSKTFYDQVHYDVIPDEHEAEKLFLSGKYHDIWPHTVKDLISKSDSKGIKKIPTYSAFTWLLYINPLRVKSLKTRKYVALNIDKDALISIFDLPKHYKTSRVIPRGLLGYEHNSTWPLDTVTTDEVSQQNKPVQLELIVAGFYYDAVMALTNKINRSKTVVSIKITKLDWNSWYKRFKAGDFDIAYFDNSPTYVNTYMYLRTYDDDLTFPGLKKKSFKALMNASLSESDRVKRGEIYKKIDDELLRDFYFIPIYSGDVPYRHVREKVKGYQVPILGWPYQKISNLAE